MEKSNGQMAVEIARVLNGLSFSKAMAILSGAQDIVRGQSRFSLDEVELSKPKLPAWLGGE